VFAREKLFAILFKGVNKAENLTENHTTPMVSEIHTKQSKK
jgi:hypothetical protein